MSDDSSEVGTIEWYYGLGSNAKDLRAGRGALEFADQVLLERYLPASPLRSRHRRGPVDTPCGWQSAVIAST